MKKVLLAVFIAACFALCVLPSLGMIFVPDSEPIGNEREAKLPSLTNSEGKINTLYPTQLGEYFQKHFAFRSMAITADAKIQASLFSVSNNDSVVVGSDGWLFYSSTLDNYFGENLFSDRETKSIVHNLDLIQRFSESNGADFLFTVAPNKNSLYPDNMPYYYKKVSDGSNREKVSKAVKDGGIEYCDLFSLFNNKNETLYFARDSHWNNKGALMAYDSILSKLGKMHDDYSATESSRKKDFTGDLSKMIFPAGSEPEYNTYYGAENRIKYVTDTKSVEDSFIKTECADASGSLYMYRDSFGNSLLPYFASAYKTATFTKSFPMMLEIDFEEAKPDTFVMELVERNLNWLIVNPPVISAPEVTFLKINGNMSGDVNAKTSECEYSPLYTDISGNVKCGDLQDNAEFYVSVTDAQGKSSVYEAYSICTDESEYAFKAYLPSEVIPADSNAEINIIVKNNDSYYNIGG